MSRHRRKFAFAVCLLLVLLLIVLDRVVQKTAFYQESPIVTLSPEASDLEKYNSKVFSVVKVVDGDTLDINIPDANHNHTRIRLWGIDTPETKKPNTPIMYFGPEASRFATESALGKNVKIFLDPNQKNRDKYRRLLAFVQLADGNYLNEELLMKGYAYADTRFKHSYFQRYFKLESAARSNKIGLWKNVKPEQFPEWIQNQRPELSN